ncbi:MAG: DUF1667 domain-containing protein [Bacillota bacterium]
MKSMTCIICPRGCSLQVKAVEDQYEVTGHMCKRGKEFAVNEMTNPTRTVTSTVKTIFPDFPVLPVKTDGEVPLHMIFEVMKQLNGVLVNHLVQSGEIIIENVLGTGINIVSTADMKLMMGV